jgi:hypothetical protein
MQTRYLKAIVIFIFVIIMIAFFVINRNIDPEKLISSALASCNTTSDRAKSILCFRNILEKSVAKYGLRPFVVAVGDMFTAGNSGLTSPTQCHDILHALGEAGGIHSGDINNTIGQCTDVCTYGCFHGVIEGYLMTGADIVKEIPQLCQIDDPDGNFKGACYHGLGHSFASIAGFDLSQSFNLCSLISEERFKIDCGSGVMMELYELGSFDHPLAQWPADIPGFCSTFKAPYSQICYTTAGLHEYGRSQNIKKAFQTCSLVPVNFFEECNISIGRNFYYVYQGAVPQIIDACRNQNENVFLSCIQGAISADHAVDPESKKGYDICSQLGNKLKDKCLGYLR